MINTFPATHYPGMSLGDSERLWIQQKASAAFEWASEKFGFDCRNPGVDLAPLGNPNDAQWVIACTIDGQQASLPIEAKSLINGDDGFDSYLHARIMQFKELEAEKYKPDLERLIRLAIENLKIKERIGELPLRYKIPDWDPSLSPIKMVFMGLPDYRIQVRAQDGRFADWNMAGNFSPGVLDDFLSRIGWRRMPNREGYQLSDSSDYIEIPRDTVANWLGI